MICDVSILNELKGTHVIVLITEFNAYIHLSVF